MWDKAKGNMFLGGCMEEIDCDLVGAKWHRREEESWTMESRVTWVRELICFLTLISTAS